MSNIDLTAVRNEIVSFATSSIPEHPHEATQDGNAFLNSARRRLQEFSDQLARKEIDRDQFEDDLTQDLLGLATMDKLKETGLSQIRISAFTEGVLQILVRAAIVAAIGAI